MSRNFRFGAICLLILASAWLGPLANANDAARAARAAGNVVAIAATDLANSKLPAFIRVDGLRVVSSLKLRRACSAQLGGPQRWLLFFPDDSRCIAVQAHGEFALLRALQAVTGQWPSPAQVQSLRRERVLVLAPQAHARSLVGSACSCGHVPTGSVQCSAQTRTAGTPIGTITFNAHDIDDDALVGSFSYQRDAGGVQAGLPAPLSGNCSNGVGSLQCTVNGDAPSPAGIVQLSLSASDGTAAVTLSSLLEVLPDVPDRIFASGFEYLGCQ